MSEPILTHVVKFAGGPAPTGAFAEALLGASVDSFVLVDAMARILYIGSDSPDLLGEDLADWVGRSALDHVQPDAHDQFVAKLQELATDEGPSTTVIHASIGSDAGWVQVELRGFNAVDYNGTRAAMVAIRDRSRFAGSVRARYTAERTRNPTHDAPYDESTAGTLLARTLRGVAQYQQALVMHIRMHWVDGPPSPEVADATILGAADRIVGHSRCDDIVARVADDSLLVVLVGLDHSSRHRELAARTFEQCLIDRPDAHDVELGYAPASTNDDYKDVLAFVRQAAQFIT